MLAFRKDLNEAATVPPLKSAVIALRDLLADIKTRRIAKLEQETSAARERRAEVARRLTASTASANKISPGRGALSPTEQQLMAELEVADRKVTEARTKFRAAREALASELNALVSPQLQMTAPALRSAADLLEGVRELFGEVDNFCRANGIERRPMLSTLPNPQELRAIAQRL